MSSVPWKGSGRAHGPKSILTVNISRPYSLINGTGLRSVDISTPHQRTDTTRPAAPDQIVKRGDGSNSSLKRIDLRGREKYYSGYYCPKGLWVTTWGRRCLRHSLEREMKTIDTAPHSSAAPQVMYQPRGTVSRIVLVCASWPRAAEHDYLLSSFSLPSLVDPGAST